MIPRSGETSTPSEYERGERALREAARRNPGFVNLRAAGRDFDARKACHAAALVLYDAARPGAVSVTTVACRCRGCERCNPAWVYVWLVSAACALEGRRYAYVLEEATGDPLEVASHLRAVKRAGRGRLAARRRAGSRTLIITDGPVPYFRRVTVAEALELLAAYLRDAAAVRQPVNPSRGHGGRWLRRDRPRALALKRAYVGRPSAAAPARAALSGWATPLPPWTPGLPGAAYRLPVGYDAAGPLPPLEAPSAHRLRRCLSPTREFRTADARPG